MYKSFQRHERHVIGATCLYLAGKVEETAKKVRFVVAALYNVKHKEKIDAGLRTRMNADRDITPEHQKSFWDLKAELMRTERLVLETITFDLSVEHPYKPMLRFAKTIGAAKELAQTSWNFINDSLRSPLCIIHEPETIAAGAMFLASKFLGQDLPEGKPAADGTPTTPWWKTMEVVPAKAEEVMMCILDLYSPDKRDETTEKMNQKVLDFAATLMASKLEAEKARGVKREREWSEGPGPRQGERGFGGSPHSRPRRNSQDEGAPPRLPALPRPRSLPARPRWSGGR